MPGVFTDEPDFYPPPELGENGYTFTEEEKVIVNVGSVGQPRDGGTMGICAAMAQNDYDVCQANAWANYALCMLNNCGIVVVED